MNRVPPPSKHLPKQPAKGQPPWQLSQQFPRPGAAQLKTTPPKRPVAPPVYRPQPVPKVLQAKMHVARPPLISSQRAPLAAPAYRSGPAPKVAQTKTAIARQPRLDIASRRPVGPLVANRKPTNIARPGPAVQSKLALPARAVVVVQCAWSKADFPRPKFDVKTYRAGAIVFNMEYEADVDPRDPEMKRHNAALPHRFSWKVLRDRTILMLNGEEDPADFYRWTQSMLDAGTEKFIELGAEARDAPDDEQELLAFVMDTISVQTKTIQKLRDQVIVDFKKRKPQRGVVTEFLKAINSYIPNVYGWGPHSGVNTRVQEHGHSHVKKGSATPMTRALWDRTPDAKRGIALTPRGKRIVDVDGRGIDPDDLTPRSRGLFDKQEHVRTRADVNAKWGGKKRRRSI
jgi:hypothetical protein